MITAIFTEEGEKLSLRLEGHAGYAEIGKDTICSSATILAYTVAQIVVEAEKQGDLKSSPIIKLEPGDTLISCEPSDFEMMQNVYQFAKVGYILLQHNYPQYVRLIES